MAHKRSQPEQIKSNQPEVKRNYLYIIQCKNDYYKIGYTSDIKGRMASMKTSNPFRLRLIYSVKMALAEELEKDLHREYSQYNIRGEWFKLTHTQVLELVKSIVGYLLENPRL